MISMKIFIKQNKILFYTIGQLYYQVYLPLKTYAFKARIRVKPHCKIMNESNRFEKIKLTESDTCFIIGNGPSLLAHDLTRIRQKGYKCFASNKIDVIFSQTDWRPDFYVAQDVNFLKKEKYYLRLKESGIPIIFLPRAIKKEVNKECDLNNIFFFDKSITNLMKSPEPCSEDINLYISAGFTVTYAAIQIAIYMGFTSIILLGIDCDYPYITSKSGLKFNTVAKAHFDSSMDAVGTSYNFANVEGMIESYKNARKFAEEKRIKILNATRGGKLEVFSRIDIDSILRVGVDNEERTQEFNKKY